MLDLLPGAFSPWLVEAVVRLATWMPFAQVPAALAFFTRVTIDEDTARRLTERAGAALVASETAEAARLIAAGPEPPRGPAVQQLSVDGAMVPLVHGEWAEVKTLAIGTVDHRPQAADAPPAVDPVHTGALSYFARLADAEHFRDLATVEVWRRGVGTAGTVCAVMDGAEWLQHFITAHAPEAVRILDFPHAAEHLSTAAHTALGAGTQAASDWLGVQLHELKHGDPDTVLAAVRALAGPPEPPESPESPESPGPSALVAACEAVAQYLEKRRAQIAYAEFQAAGYPIGSGVVESANKLVVEARLKGSGMHWARPNVDPLLALRGAACSDRWTETWPQLWGEQRRQVAQRRGAARARRQPPPPAAPPPPEPGGELPPLILRPSLHPPRPPRIVDGHPTDQHPWKKFRLLHRRSPAPDTAKT